MEMWVVIGALVVVAVSNKFAVLRLGKQIDNLRRSRP